MEFDKDVAKFTRSAAYKSYISKSLKKILGTRRKNYNKAKTEYRKAVRRNERVEATQKKVIKTRSEVSNVVTMMKNLLANKQSENFDFGNKNLKNLKIFNAPVAPAAPAAPAAPVARVPVLGEEDYELRERVYDFRVDDMTNITVNPVGIYDHVFVIPEDYLNILRAIRQGTRDVIPHGTIEVKVTLLADKEGETYNIYFKTYSIEMFRKRYNINADFLQFNYDSSDTLASYAVNSLNFENARYAYNYYPNMNLGERRKGIAQFFAEGLTNCLLTPIRDFFKTKKDLSKTKKTKELFQTKINNIDALMIQYEAGVPQDKIQEICDKLYVSIEILDIFNKITMAFEGKHSRKRFRLVNTKFNHVDVFRDIEDFETKKLKSYCEMNTFADKLKEQNEQFIHYESILGINKIVTKDTIYEIEDAYKEVASEFSKEIGIYKACAIDHVTEKRLSNYLHSGLHVSGCVDYVDNINDYRNRNDLGDLDHEKSYTQFKTCKYYKGFMPKPSDVFRKIDIPKEEYKTFLNTVIGIFTIKNVNNDNVEINTRKHISKLGIYGHKENVNDIDDETLPCAELLFMLDLGFTFDIVFGCYSHINNKFEFEFTDIMKNSKIKTFTSDDEQKTGASYYAMWSGCLGHASEYKYVNCHMSDDKLMDIVCNNYEIDEIHRISGKEAQLRVKKLHSKYCPQVLAFIVSYARINVLSQLFEFKYENTIRVNADAFFFKGKIEKVHDKFRNKDDGKIKNNEGAFRYYNCTLSTFALEDEADVGMNKDNYITTEELFPMPRHNNNNTYTYMHQILLKIGCGGGGKTFSALSDQGYNNVCYVAPSHKLLVAKAQEFKQFKLCTLAKLTGSKMVSEEEQKEINEKKNKKEKREEKKGCLMLFNKYSPATIVCDEITQYTDFQKKFIIETYKYSKIIFCGDISADGKIMYQLPCMIGKPFSTEGINCVEEYNVSRRCKCEKLSRRLASLRDAIENGYSGAEMINSIVKRNNFNIVKPSEMQYGINDYILCSKRNCNVHGKSDCNCDGKNFTYEWTKKYEDKFKNGKYLMVQKIDGYCNGDVIIAAERPQGSIPRHAFTCHQIQGETIKNNKIFIDSRNLFDVAMLYTAVSRAEYFNQIYIIHEGKPEIKEPEATFAGVQKMYDSNNKRILIGD